MLNLFANQQAKRALQHVYHSLRNARATAEAVAPTPVSGLAFRNMQLVAAMGQTAVAINVSRGNCCNPQVVAR